MATRTGKVVTDFTSDINRMAIFIQPSGEKPSLTPRCDDIIIIKIGVS